MRLDDFESRVPIFDPTTAAMLPWVLVTRYRCDAEAVPGDKTTFTVTATPQSQRFERAGWRDGGQGGAA